MTTAAIGRAQSFGLVIIWVTCLTILTGATWYYTPRSDPAPVNAPTRYAQDLIVAQQDTSRSDDLENWQSPLAPAANFAPFLNIVPGEDGTNLFISAGTNEVAGTVVADVGVGGTSHKGGTMVYSNTIQAYVVTIDSPGLMAGSNQDGDIFITTTTGLSTDSVDFNRAYIPSSTTDSISSIDGNLQLTLLSPDTFPSQTYVVVVPSFGPPGPPPSGHRLVGSAYSIRASGALTASLQPMLLRLYYGNVDLGGADPSILAIFAWDANPSNRHWDNLGGTLNSTQEYLSVATSRFTTYALMAPAPENIYLPLIMK